MTIAKASDRVKRVNIVMLESVKEYAACVMRARLKGDNFSELVRDLIVEEYKRMGSGGHKSQDQYMAEMVELLARNRALEATIKDKMERFKLERKGLSEALALCEADLKQARASAT
jgi:hypothetical protein